MKPVVCIGAALIDDTFASHATPVPGTSNPATHRRSAGGVARNVAHHLAQLGHAVELVAHFGTDAEGDWLAGHCRAAGIGISHAHTSDAGSGRYTTILSPDGELFAAASDTRCEEELPVAFLARRAPLFGQASLLLADGNLAPDAVAWLCRFGREQGIPFILEPVSAPKAARMAGLDLRETLLVTPNAAELASLAGTSVGEGDALAVERLLARGVRAVWMRRGREGSHYVSPAGKINLPAPAVGVLDATGAGDAALAGWIHAWLLGKNERDRLRYGHAMAGIILQTRGASAERLRPDLLESAVARQEPHAP
jgi:pseudouridine kinase